LIKDFSKKELISCAKELGFKSIPEMSSIAWVRSILDDVYLNGVFDFKDCSDLLAEFLVAAEIYTDKGVLLVVEDKVSNNKPKKQSKPVVKTASDDAPKPECYSFWDTEDPACKRCKIVVLCKQAQINNRPECFGKQFDEKAPECQECIIAFMCQNALNQN
jgi:hypothetical protein